MSIYQENRKFDRTYARLHLALMTAQLLQKPGMIDRAAKRKHEWVLAYMKQNCAETISRYRNMTAPANLHEPQHDPKLWSMWWQGEDQADPLFKMCINSARKHTHRPVVTLTKDNYHEYFEIPDHILRKFSEGKITEGGFFTGATVWWSQDAPEGVLDAPFYTCRAVTRNHENVSRSRWVGYVMGGNKEFPLFSFTRDCLHEYWEKCDQDVDYLMMDYIFELAYRNIPCVREMIDSLPEKNNMLRNDLIFHLEDPYDAKTFRKYTDGDTFLYKLSWKFGRKDIVTTDGKESNYGHMLSEKC